MNKNMFLGVLLSAVALSSFAAEQKIKTAQEASKALFDAIEVESKTPIAQTERIKTIDSLLKQFPEIINMKDEDKNTPLTESIWNNEVFDRIFAAKPDLNAQDNNGNTALILAANLGNTYIVQKLLAAGARLNIKNNEGKTAASMANETNLLTKTKNTEMARLLEEAEKKKSQ